MPKALLLFASIAFSITVIWFRQGLMYGGAEVGLLTHNPQRSLEIQQFIWWASSAPGMLVPHFITGVPFYFVLSVLQTLFSPTSLQAMIFFLLLFLMGYGMYLFCLSVIGQDKRFYAMLGGLFYIFNSYTMVDVWHRFLYTGFFLAAFLPFFALIWKQWINGGKFLFLVLFLLTNLIASYMFGNLASVITVWLLLLLLTTADIIFPFRGKKEAVKIVSRFLVGLIFWILTNSWWLIATFTVSAGLFPEQHSSEDNISTLINIGKKTILPYTLQFANPFYLFFTAELGEIFKSLSFRIISWLPVSVIFVGILLALKRKLLASFAVIYLLAIIFSKGSASPFSYPYIWAFENIYALGVIRNPYEKLGILLPFFGSILFVIGLESIRGWVIRKWGIAISNLLIITTLSTILIFAHPIFLGRVFEKGDSPVLVEVPKSYKEADDWFKLQKEKYGNILHLPFSGKDVVTLNWRYGYHGVAIEELLFNHLPSISRNVGIKRVDDTLSSLTYLFREPFWENRGQLLKTLQDLNVSFIVLHKDVKWMDQATYGGDIRINNPSEIEVILNNLDFLQKTAVFGDLIIYRLKNPFYQPKIILSNTADLIYPGESKIMNIFPFVEKGDQIITEDYGFQIESVLSKIKKISIFPQKSLNYSIASESAMVNIANSMIYNPNGSDYTIYLLKVIQDTFAQTGELNSQQFAKQLILANQSLIKFLNQQSDESKSSDELKLTILDDYQNSLKKIFNKNLKTSSFYNSFKTQIANIFNLHLYILEQINEQGLSNQSKILEIQKNLINNLKENNLLPTFLESYIPGEEEINRKILQFKTPLKSKYELLMPYHNINITDLYPDFLSKIDIQINGNSLSSKGRIDKDIISFGEYDFDKGIHEVSYNSLLSSNLVPSLDKFQKVGHVDADGSETIHLNSDQGGVAFLESPIKLVTGGDIFKISIDANFKSGSQFYIELIQDKESQTIQPGECDIHTCYLINLYPSTSGWQRYSLSTQPLKPLSQKAKVRILVVGGDVLIKNFHVNRVYNWDVILRKNLEINKKNSLEGSVTIEHHTPVSYFGKIKIYQPSFLFFKETFHPGWKLQLTKGDETYKIDTHLLGNLYGNLWFIEKKGEYNFKLEFEPQKNVDKGLVLATLGWMSVLVILVWSGFRRKHESN